MNWQTLYLSADGRIRRKEFWIGALILMIVWVLSPLFHVLAPMIWLALLYPWICVFSKRLHDFGKSGFLILLPFAVGALALMAAVIVGGIGGIGALITAANGGSEPSSWAVVFGALGVALSFLAVAALVKFVFVLWVGLSPGDRGENRYGPPPEAAVPPSPLAAQP